MRKILFGTRNKTRLEFLKGILSGLPLEVLGLNDLSIEAVIEETGNRPEDNARQKSVEYYKHALMPTFSIDSGLYIEKFTSEKQPGVFVRRINKDSYEANDEEMLAYYIRELEKCGGSSPAQWINAISLVVSESEIYNTVFARETLLTVNRCEAFNIGEPLNSIQIDSHSKKYVAELSVAEKIVSQKMMVDAIRQFFLEHLEFICHSE